MNLKSMGLETLKDIEKDYGHSGIHFYGYDKKELKQLAIKWKEYLKAHLPNYKATDFIDDLLSITEDYNKPKKK